MKWFWAGNAFLLIGGGPAVVNNMFFIILADVTSEEERCVAIIPYVSFLSDPVYIVWKVVSNY